MKKFLPGIFAIVVAISLSSFTNGAFSKKAVTQTYWFDAASGLPAGTTSSPTFSPDPDCTTAGSGCINGYESDVPLTQAPNRPTDGTFAHN
jgi:hypothetical protein